MSLFTWIFGKNEKMEKQKDEPVFADDECGRLPVRPSLKEKTIEERWKLPPDDECGRVPIRPKEPKFNYYKDAKPDKTPINPPLTRKEKVFQGNAPGMPNIIVERGGEYPDWKFPVVVPNVLRDSKLTCEQIKEIAFIHQTHCLSKPSIGHPEFENCDIAASREQIKKWLSLTENLFLETDQSSFDAILSELSRKMPSLKLEWKHGVLCVNEAKTKINCKNIDRAWKALRKIGTHDHVLEFIVDLIGRQLSEIFVA